MKEFLFNVLFVVVMACVVGCDCCCEQCPGPQCTPPAVEPVSPAEEPIKFRVAPQRFDDGRVAPREATFTGTLIGSREASHANQ